jgi:hypothetical protein
MDVYEYVIYCRTRLILDSGGEVYYGWQIISM